VIDVKKLEKAYGSHCVLKGIDEHIEKGEKVVIIGPSGAGRRAFTRSAASTSERAKMSLSSHRPVRVSRPSCAA